MSTEGLSPGLAGYYAAQNAHVALQKASLDVDVERTNLESAQAKLSADRKMMELMQGNPVSPENPGISSSLPKDEADAAADNLFRMSQAATLAGKYGDAADYASKATRMLSQKSTMAHQKALEDEADAKILTNVLNGVEISDQASWQSALDNYATLNPRAKNDPGWQQLKQTEYSPELVQAVRHATTTQVEDSRIRANDARRAREKAEQALIPVRKAEIESRTRLHNTRDEALKKNGGNYSAGLPKPEEIKEATVLIAKDYQSEQSPETKARIQASARDMVVDARILMNERKDLTYNEALKQVYNIKKAEGEFSGLKVARKGPGSRAKPLNMPSARPGLDEAGQWYTAPAGSRFAGQALFWTGDGFLTEDEYNNRKSTGAVPGQDTGDDEEED